jgi:hypothetical protein
MVKEDTNNYNCLGSRNLIVSYKSVINYIYKIS